MALFSTSFLSLFIVSQWILSNMLSSDLIFQPQPPPFGIEVSFLTVSLFLMSTFGSGYFSWFLLCSTCEAHSTFMLTSHPRIQTNFSFLSQECFCLFSEVRPSYHKSISPSLCEASAQNFPFHTSTPNFLASAFCGLRP